MVAADNPTFTIFGGPMFSGKTSSLLMKLERFRHQNKKIIAFKPLVDERYSKDEIVTHMGLKYPAHCVKNGLDILNILAEDEETYHVVAVDEQFMLPGSSEVIIWLFKKGYHIVVSTLDLSYQGKPFAEVTKLLPYATKIVKCTSVCVICGKDAFYTHLKIQTDAEAEILIGGAEAYEPRCARCYPEFFDLEIT